MDWTQIEKPLSGNLFDKYTHQSIVPPLDCLNIDEITWNQCRTFALKLADKGFLDPLAILYASFKRFYPNCTSIRSFARWLSLHEQNQDDFKNYFKQYSIHSTNIYSTGELIRSAENLQLDRELSPTIDQYDQIWFLFSISIRIPANDYALIADTLILDDGVTRFSVRHRKTTSSSRIHCLFALTPSGKFSNQLIICKQNKHLKMNFQSSSFTHIVQTTTGDIYPEHIQQWFEDFLSLSYGKDRCAILIDPRTTLLTSEIENLCDKSQVDLITTDLNSYLIRILVPIISLFDKQCSEVNRLDRMFLKSASDFKRIIFTIWCSLRTLKQNEQIYEIFRQTKFWKNQDELYRQSVRASLPTILIKKKKKKSIEKSGRLDSNSFFSLQTNLARILL